MNKGHTNGPWHVANGVQIRSEHDQIAKVWMMRNGEGKANACLIAAAPDLLEALQYAVQQVPELGDVPGVSAAIARAVAGGSGMTRFRSFLKFIRFYRSLGHGRLDALRRAWGVSRYA